MDRSKNNIQDIIMRSLRVEYLAPSNVILRPCHETRTFFRRTIPAINQYTGGRVWFEKRGEPPQTVEDGCGILIRSNFPYRSGISNATTRRRGISFRLAILGGMDPLLLLEPPFLLDRETADTVGTLNRELFAARAEDNFLANAARTAETGLRLLLEIIRRSQLRPDAALRLELHETLRPVFDFIHENYNSDIPVKRLARLTSLSESRFFRVFKNVSGLSPNQYILNYRLKKAEEMLLGDAYIYEIAEKTGFQDQYYFSRIFRKKTGMTPRQFRHNASFL
ncbi:MAG: AraC family transcriptional regulator [Victivallaceae bacterium]